MKAEIIELYKARRAPHFRMCTGGIRYFYQPEAKYILANVKHELNVRAGWAALNGEEVFEYDASDDNSGELVRLLICPDDSMDWDDLKGDCYDPDLHPDIKPEILKKQEEEEIERVNREGVYGVKGEFFDGEGWIETDDCWGFVGDDWKESGYDIDIMRSAIDGYNKHRKEMHAEAKREAQIEASQPLLMACYI